MKSMKGKATLNASKYIFHNFYILQDKHIDRFFHLCKMVEEGNIPARIEANMEGELKRA